MLTMKTSLVLFLGLAAMIETCAGLYCYLCQGGGCADPFNATGASVQECPEGNKCAAAASGGSFTRSCLPAADCINGCFEDVCAYCCDGDLCNSQSIAEGTNGTLQCYNCFDSSDSSTTEGIGPCDDPFDPNDEEVFTVPCDGKCLIGYLNLPYDGGKWVFRSCALKANVSEQCGAGCNNMACTTCCSDNLCNGGALPVPPTQPSGAGKSLQDEIFAKGVLVVLLVMLGCM